MFKSLHEVLKESLVGKKIQFYRSLKNGNCSLQVPIVMKESKVKKFETIDGLITLISYDAIDNELIMLVSNLDYGNWCFTIDFNSGITFID